MASFWPAYLSTHATEYSLRNVEFPFTNTPEKDTGLVRIGKAICRI